LNHKRVVLVLVYISPEESLPLYVPASFSNPWVLIYSFFSPLVAYLYSTFDRNITQLVVHFLTLKVKLNLIKWDADSGGYTQTFI